jgi:hypothetical protein
MSQINQTVANNLADSRADLYNSATLRDSSSTIVATYSLGAGAFNAATGGEAQLSGPITSTALVDADFSTVNGTLTLTGPSGEEEVLTAGGPGSGAEAIVENDLQTSTGEVYESKACNLTSLTLKQPYTA